MVVFCCFIGLNLDVMAFRPDSLSVARIDNRWKRHNLSQFDESADRFFNDILARRDEPMETCRLRAAGRLSCKF